MIRLRRFQTENHGKLVNYEWLELKACPTEHQVTLPTSIGQSKSASLSANYTLLLGATFFVN
jgi:hypothetical protein